MAWVLEFYWFLLKLGNGRSRENQRFGCIESQIWYLGINLTRGRFQWFSQEGQKFILTILQLRSPLHGILGSAELLADSTTNSLQVSLVESIEMCGRTLLDTIDHLLDHSKINHLTQRERESRKISRHKRRGSSALHAKSEHRKVGGVLGNNSDIDLSAVTEEVIAAVSAGHEAGILPRRSSGKTPAIQADTRLLHLDDLTVSIDIAKALNWRFHTEVGAWRRICMNLYANSVK
jgi:signal transduction histidine kinase